MSEPRGEHKIERGHPSCWLDQEFSDARVPTVGGIG